VGVIKLIRSYYQKISYLREFRKIGIKIPQQKCIWCGRKTIGIAPEGGICGICFEWNSAMSSALEAIYNLPIEDIIKKITSFQHVQKSHCAGCGIELSPENTIGLKSYWKKTFCKRCFDKMRDDAKNKPIKTIKIKVVKTKETKQ
jgi:hypothetical protein